MKGNLDELANRFTATLREHIVKGGEPTLTQAYELGRRALAEGLGVEEMVTLYHRALLTVVNRGIQSSGASRIIEAAGELFAESLAPFEMTHRGFKETNALLIKANEELRQINAELESFGYTISHDLRAPLRHMQGFAQALLEDCADRLDSVDKDYAHRIMAAAQRLDAQINDLLAYSRLGLNQFKIEPVSLTSVVKVVVNQLEPDLRKRQAQIRVEETQVEILGHRDLLLRVLTDLLTNAVKFVAAGVRPEVRIMAEDRGEWVRLWVEDNGIGIPAAQQERIFGLFQRLHSDEAYPGTGIGLANVRKGVTKMGGRVGVESAPGKGSKFWVELKKANPAS